MREFNTSGPCDPDKHYTVMREALVAKGQVLVDRGRFFTIFAPRQAGKTTYFQLLFRQLEVQGYLPIWISFEGLRQLSKARFYHAFSLRLFEELAEYNPLERAMLEDAFDLEIYLKQLSLQAPPIVLIIDEFEDVPSEVMSELLHVFRAMYQKRKHHKLHALALVGVSTLADLVVSAASPFNVVDELRIDYFTFAEVEQLIGQYVAESAQTFDTKVIKAIYENTQGQPGLTCALCHYLVTEIVTDRSHPVTMAAFYPTLQYFLIERRDKNILNIVSKAREKYAFMLRVLFGNAPIPYTVDDPDINYLSAHGVVANIDGVVQVPVPLYSKRLITAFRPSINGESNEYIVSAHERLDEFVIGDQLNVHALLDILILYRNHKYIIETKRFTDNTYFEQGKAQSVDYLKSEGLTDGYYVVFSNKHSENDTLFTSEVLDAKQIHTWIIRTDFEKAGRYRKRIQKNS